MDRLSLKMFREQTPDSYLRTRTRSVNEQLHLTLSSQSIRGSKRRGKRTLLGPLKETTSLKCGRQHMALCGGRVHCFGTLPRVSILAMGTELLVQYSNRADVRANRGNWNLLLSRYMHSQQPFQSRPAQFLVYQGRWSYPSECRSLHHHLVLVGREYLDPPSLLSRPCLPSLHPCHLFLPLHHDHHGRSNLEVP